MTQFPTITRMIKSIDWTVVAVTAVLIALFTGFLWASLATPSTQPYAVPSCGSSTVNTTYATRHDECITFTTTGTITVWDGATASLVTTPCVLRCSEGAAKIYADGHVYAGHTSQMSSDSGWYEVDNIHLIK